MSDQTILVVDDDSRFAQAFKTALRMKNTQPKWQPSMTARKPCSGF